MINNQHEKLNYVEFASTNLTGSKTFFANVFHWQFTDYGHSYTAFDHQGLTGGFFQSNKVSIAENGGALLVFYSDKLSHTYQKVLDHGGLINKEPFAFPGGFRFHFIEPGGNEFAVWSEKLT